MTPQLIAIICPTASGKTTLAVRLAQELEVNLVSADSRQVYTGLDIGTAKDLTHKHYLVDMRKPSRPLTLADWQKAALTVIDRLIAADTIPLLVGGTMLYMDSIIDNYEIPTVPPNMELRECWEHEHTRVLDE